ncbi:MAG TPA: competence/damage-inducible protein A [Gaiellales bacterium]|nr:competence/damage-inducible protein A [Gaiellales bacterium]
MSRPRAAILLTGNELLRGVISDANAPHLARALERLGFSLTRTVIVGDDLDDIRAGLRTVLEAADLVVTSGGLGPTHDDRTVEAIAAEAGVPLVLDEDVLGRITRWTNGVAERYGFEPGRFDAGNRKQAHIPEGSDVLGIAGTAPALVVRMGEARLVVLPGVPSELRRLWPLAPDHPALAELFARAQPRRQWLIRTYGIGESHVADLFAEVGGDPEGVETSICARNFEIEIDIRAEGRSEQNGAAMNERMTAALGEFVFAHDERPLSEIVLDLLGEQGWTAATAESCTGGMVAARLTDIAGSSEAFAGGVVAYSNELKMSLLGVPAELLEAHGAVSAEVAEAMAEGARERLGADVAVSVTGVAGPGGGTEDKPVGLVYLHVASPAGGEGRRMEWPGDRAVVRARATVAALQLLRAHVVAASAHARS